MKENEWHWKEGIANTAEDHVEIYHGKSDSAAKLVALLGPPK